MRREHFERVAPICLHCRSTSAVDVPLTIGTVAREVNGDIIEGTLVCTQPLCQLECPIIDGIPIIVPDIRQFISDNIEPLLTRDDLTPLSEGLIRDCLGTNASIITRTYFLSCYAQDHYLHNEGACSVLGSGIDLLTRPPSGLWLDIGCATAGASFELSKQTNDLVLGIDTNITLLRFARQLIANGVAQFPRKRSGVVYDQQTIEVDNDCRQRVEVWACDATALPFRGQTFAGGVSLNVVDAVNLPVRHLSELGRVLGDNCEAIIASPYDWQETVTPLPHWIGGHSPRSHSGGDSVTEMRRLLSEKSPEELGIRLRLVDEIDGVPWRVSMNERAAVTYQTHLIIARAAV